MKRLIVLFIAFFIGNLFMIYSEGHRYWTDECGYEYIDMDGVVYTTDAQKVWYPWELLEKKSDMSLKTGFPIKIY